MPIDENILLTFVNVKSSIQYMHDVSSRISQEITQVSNIAGNS